MDAAVGADGRGQRAGECGGGLRTGAGCSTPRPEIWAKLMDTNARGPFFVMQRFAALAIARGEPAAVVNILSMVIHCGQSFLAPYTASKAALAALAALTLRNLAPA